LTILGSHISGQDGYNIAIDFLNKGILKVDKIVTHSFPLENWQKAYEVSGRGDESIKVLVIPEKATSV